MHLLRDKPVRLHLESDSLDSATGILTGWDDGFVYLTDGNGGVIGVNKRYVVGIEVIEVLS